ncbi:hypothetical protein AMTRI_Chr01g131040 [Amborella trichopoda]
MGAGTAVSAAGVAAASGVKGSSLSATEWLRRIMDRLVRILKGGPMSNSHEFFQLCILLSRVIDSSILSNEIPAVVHDLPQLVKQICDHKDDRHLLPAMMVLMFSVKNACSKGWFRVLDTEELLVLVNEISSCFCNVGNNILPSSSALNIISKIIPRCPGYDALVSDFHIPKNPVMVPQEKIRLFVVRTDNMETTSCIVTPPHVNFLLNGKGVDKRINSSLDTGPQFPTDVTALLKMGTNLLQAIGDFNGNYVIAIAVMDVGPCSDSTTLQDYVQPAVSAVTQDDELLEGPSRISLSCPISFKRIKTPVKGGLCRHHQCFDYENYLKINSRRPSWRCPHCNQATGFPDLRIDQKMVQILGETREDVADVLISGDGSWKVATDDDGSTEHMNGGTHRNDQDSCEHNVGSNVSKDVVDLTIETEETNERIISMEVDSTSSKNTISHETINNSNDCEERKPCLENLQRLSVTETLSGPPVTNTARQASQVADYQSLQNFWMRALLASASIGPNAPVNVGAVSRVGVSESIGSPVAGSVSRVGVSESLGNIVSRVGASESVGNPSVGSVSRVGVLESVGNPVFGDVSRVGVPAMVAPVLTDAISPAPNREPLDTQVLAQASSSFQSVPVPQGRQLLPTENCDVVSQLRQLNAGIVGDTHRIPRVHRTPIAIQALPAQSQGAKSLQRMRGSLPNSSSVAINASSSPNSSLSGPFGTATVDGVDATNVGMERQHFSWQQINAQGVADVAAAPTLQLQSISQNRPEQSFQPVVSLQAPIQHSTRSHQQSPSEQSLPNIVGLQAPMVIGTRNPLEQQTRLHQSSPYPKLTLQNPYQWPPHQTLNQSEPFQRQIPHHTFHTPQSKSSSGIGATISAAGIPTINAPLLSQSQSSGGMAATISAGCSPNVSSHPLISNRSRPKSFVPIRPSAPSLQRSTESSRFPISEQRWNVQVQSVTRPEELISEQNWRPSGRMRGSLNMTQYFAQSSVLGSATSPPASTSQQQMDSLHAEQRSQPYL